MKNKNRVFVLVVLMLVILACTMPGAPAAPANGSAATITALAGTIQAQGGQSSSSQSQGNSSAPASTPTMTLTPTLTLTVTPSVPMVSVTTNTNCRTGPGTVYDMVGGLNTGQTAEVVGKYTPANYWIIKNPNGSGTCWLWGQYATISGDTSNIPEMVPPPTPTPSIPAAPTGFTVHISCTLQAKPIFLELVHIEMTWTDVATNEDGYYIFRNGSKLQTLPANSTSASDDTTLPALYIIGHPKPSVTYGVQAFNSAGTSSTKEKSVSCP